MTPEAKVKNKVIETVTLLGGHYVMPIGSMYGHNGVPDFLVCLAGRFIGIECKAGRNKWPSALQVGQLQAIEDAGGKAMVVHDSNVHLLPNEIHSETRQPYWAEVQERAKVQREQSAAQDAKGGITIRRK